MRSLVAVVVVAVGCLVLGCATEGAAPNDIKPRANLTAADFYPLAPGWKWAYDVEKDGINILATYAVVERTGDTAVVQTGDEKLTYAVTPDGIVQKDGGMLGDYVIKNPVKAGAEWAVEGGRAHLASVTADFKLDSGEHYFGCIVIEVTRTDPVRVTRTTFAPDLGPVMLEVQVQDGAKFTTITRARLRAVTRPGDAEPHLEERAENEGEEAAGQRRPGERGGEAELGGEGQRVSRGDDQRLVGAPDKEWRDATAVSAADVAIGGQHDRPGDMNLVPFAERRLEVQRPVGPGDLVAVVAADEDDRTGEIDARRARPVGDRHLAAAVLVAPLRRAHLDRVPVDARRARQRGAQVIGGDDPRGDVGEIVLRPISHIGHRADRARPRLRQERRQPSPPPGDPRQQAGAAQQPSDGDPGAGEIDHPERARTERNLSDGAEQPRRDLSRREQSAGRLSDPPAEPDRCLAEADGAQRDLSDGDDANGDLTDRDHADGGWPPPGRRVDAAHHVHQRQPTDPQSRSVLEARRSTVHCPRRSFMRSHH